MPNDEVASQNSFDSRRPNGKYDAGRDYIAVARGSDLVVIRVVGAGNMLIAPGLAEFAEEQRKAGFRRFLFDMERCSGLDSTFMGVMVGMHSALKPESGQHARVEAEASAADGLQPISPEEALHELRTKFSSKADEEAPAPSKASARMPSADGSISAVNVSAEIRGLMSMLGVDKFVKVRGICDLAQLETTMLPERTIAPNDRRKLILKAHENLVEIDKRNEAQFGAFLKSLSMELSKDQ